MTHTPRHARSRSSPHTMTDPAITTDGEFLDPVFATAEAAGAALARLASIRTIGANSQEHHG
jgi:hypothetical protein